MLRYIAWVENEEYRWGEEWSHIISVIILENVFSIVNLIDVNIRRKKNDDCYLWLWMRSCINYMWLVYRANAEGGRGMINEREKRKLYDLEKRQVGALEDKED